MKKIVFLFGAGASAFCGLLNAPPTAKNLYSKLIQQDNLIKWKNLPTEFKLKFEDNNSNNYNFETILDDFVSNELKKYGNSSVFGSSQVSPTPSTLDLMFELAKYFIDFSDIKENTHYNYLLDLIVKNKDLISCYLFTINYDIILDELLTKKQIPKENYFKLHGSCNWFLPNNIKIAAKNNMRISQDPNFCLIDTESIPRELSRENSIFEYNCGNYPIIATYAKIKRTPFLRSYFKKLWGCWDNMIENCDFIVIVGVSFNEFDSHIWNSLLKNYKKIIYIDPNAEDYEKKAQKKDPNIVWKLKLTTGFGKDSIDKLFKEINKI